MSNIHEKLADIQQQMHAPKNKNNDFGGYKYRNAEGIIAAFKSLGIEGASIVCSDTLQAVGGQIFVTSSAALIVDGLGTIEAVGHAMHPLQKKGMDASQITGSASSYARKYALCGLFAIEDESQDPDSRDNRQEHGQTPPPVVKVTPAQAAKLSDLAERSGSDIAKTLRAKGLSGDSWADLPADMYQAAFDGMTAKIAKMEAASKQNDNADLGGDGIPDFEPKHELGSEGHNNG